MDCKDKDRAEETEAETLSKKTVLLIGTTITFFQLLDPIYSISFLLFLIILIFQKNVCQHCIHVRGPRLLPYESDSGCSTAVSAWEQRNGGNTSREHGRERLLALFSSSNHRLSPAAAAPKWQSSAAGLKQHSCLAAYTVLATVVMVLFFRVESGKKPAPYNIRVFKVLPPTAASDARASQPCCNKC